MKHCSFRRIIDLDRMIRNKALRSARQAAEYFEVSRRTIERDLEELKEDLGAPLVYNRRKGYYEYEGEPATLPAQWLNAREIAIVLIAERALRVFTGTSLDKDVHPAFNKLLDPIRHDRKMMDHIRNLCRSVIFFSPTEGFRDVRAQFSSLLEAILSRQRVSLVYAEPKGRKRHIEMNPFALLNHDREWVLLGSSPSGKPLETLELWRIESVKIQDHYFDMPEKIEPKHYLKQDKDIS